MSGPAVPMALLVSMLAITCAITAWGVSMILDPGGEEPLVFSVDGTSDGAPCSGSAVSRDIQESSRERILVFTFDLESAGASHTFESTLIVHADTGMPVEGLYVRTESSDGMTLWTSAGDGSVVYRMDPDGRIAGITVSDGHLLLDAVPV